jgi:hypothetical protein
VGVNPTRQTLVGALRTMIERTATRFGIKPEWLVGDTAYGSAPNLDWLVNEQKIAPYIPVIDKSKREDGTFSRDDFSFDKERDIYICPASKFLTTTRKVVTDDLLLYRLASATATYARSKCDAARRSRRVKSPRAVAAHLPSKPDFCNKIGQKPPIALQKDRMTFASSPDMQRGPR